MTEALPLTYLEAGEIGEPLLIIHGLFGSARNWASLARRFGERRHVYALDLRNHGQAPWAADMSYAAMAADVRRFIDDRGFQRLSIIGHSMGGKVAMTVALTWPELIDRLVVVDIAPVAYTHSYADTLSAMRGLDLSGERMRRADFEAALRPLVASASMRSFLLQNLVAEHGRYHWRINLEALAAADRSITGFPDPGAKRCDQPALFVNGGQSDYLLPAYRPLILRHFPKAQFETIANTGHWPHADHPDEFARLIEAFL